MLACVEADDDTEGHRDSILALGNTITELSNSILPYQGNRNVDQDTGIAFNIIYGDGAKAMFALLTDGHGEKYNIGLPIIEIAKEYFKPMKRPISMEYARQMITKFWEHLQYLLCNNLLNNDTDDYGGCTLCIVYQEENYTITAEKGDSHIGFITNTESIRSSPSFAWNMVTKFYLECDPKYCMCEGCSTIGKIKDLLNLKWGAFYKYKRPTQDNDNRYLYKITFPNGYIWEPSETVGFETKDVFYGSQLSDETIDQLQIIFSTPNISCFDTIGYKNSKCFITSDAIDDNLVFDGMYEFITYIHGIELGDSFEFKDLFLSSRNKVTASLMTSDNLNKIKASSQEEAIWIVSEWWENAYSSGNIDKNWIDTIRASVKYLSDYPIFSRILNINDRIKWLQYYSTLAYCNDNMLVLNCAMPEYETI